MARYKTRAAGKDKLVTATSTSTGVAEAGDIVSLDSSGNLDITLLPLGAGPDTKVLEASEDLAAGDYVNIYDDGGTPKVRLADNSNSRDAHGFVVAAVVTAANATVYFEGTNTAVAAGTTGQRAYLGTAGDVITTPLVEDDIGNAGKLSQFLGVYVDTNEINTDIDDCLLL